MISREGSFLRKLEFRSKLGIEFHGWRSVTGFPYARKYFFACTFEIASRRGILHFRRKLRIRERDMKWKAHRYVTKTRFHDRPKAKFNLFRERSIFGAIFFFFLPPFLLLSSGDSKGWRFWTICRPTIRHVDNYSEMRRDCNARVARHRDNIRRDRSCARRSSRI